MRVSGGAGDGESSQGGARGPAEGTGGEVAGRRGRAGGSVDERDVVLVMHVAREVGCVGRPTPAARMRRALRSPRCRRRSRGRARARIRASVSPPRPRRCRGLPGPRRAGNATHRPQLPALRPAADRTGRGLVRLRQLRTARRHGPVRAGAPILQPLGARADLWRSPPGNRSVSLDGQASVASSIATAAKDNDQQRARGQGRSVPLTDTTGGQRAWTVSMISALSMPCR
jgi:hypothetical protein